MTSFPNWRCFLDEVRTFFEQTPPTKEAPPTLKLWRAGTPATARQARHTTEKYSLLFSFCLPAGRHGARRTCGELVESISFSLNEKSIFLWCLAMNCKVAGLASF